MKTLFIDACVRECSRTKILAEHILSKIGGEIQRLALSLENIKPLNADRLAEREEFVKHQAFDQPIFKYAKQFAGAEQIVIAAPFWDLSFPAILKIYLENVCVGGVTFKYDKGRPVGLCRAKKLIYVTTSGGKIFEDFGFSYVKSLAKNFFGIEEVCSFYVENLDVDCVQGREVLNKEIIQGK